MAIRLLTANATLSTSAGSWKKIEAAQFGPDFFAVSQYTDTFTKQVGPALTVTNGVSLEGAFLPLNRSATTTGTFTVALEENVASVWTQKAITASLNVSSLLDQWGFVYVTFSAPYTATANQFRLAVKASLASRVSWMKSAAAGPFMGGIVGAGDNTTAPASGDTICLANGVSLTIDASCTFGPTNENSIIMGQGTTFTCPAPASALTIAMGSGTVLLGNDVVWRVGTSGSRVSAANKVKITSTAAANSILFANPNFAFMTFAATTPKTVFELYGAVSTALRLIIAADAASGQDVITTTAAIPASWVNGDTVRVCGKDSTTYNVTNHTISTTGTNQITLTGNLDVTALKGAALVNITEAQRNLGIQVKSTNYCRFQIASTNSSGGITGWNIYDYQNVDGVYFEGVGPTFTSDSGGTSTTTSTIKNVLFFFTTGNVSYNSAVISSNKGFTAIDNFHMINDYNSFVASVFVIYYGNNATLNNVTISQLSHGSINIYGNNLAVNDLIVYAVGGSSANSATQGNLRYTMFGGSLTNATHIGGQVQFISCLGLPVTNFVQKRSNGAGTVFLTSVVNFMNSTFGIGATNSTSDIYFTTTNLSQITATNCNIGSAGVANNEASVAGTFIRFVNYNQTVGDHRSWYTYGTFTSNGDAIVEISSSGVNPLVNTLNINSQTISAYKLFISSGCTISNAAYYAGVYVLPKMEVDYDLTTVAVQTASASTAAQNLQQIITPSTSNNPVNVLLKAQTDAVAPNNKVTFAYLTLSQRNYGYIFVDVVPPISQTTDSIVGTVATPVANPFISEAVQATVDAYTGISIDGSGNITLTSSHTLNELYDYCQSFYSKDANGFSPISMTTADGQTFTMSKNLTVTNCDLTGTSTQVLAMGSNTLATTGTGRVLAVYSTVAGKSGLLGLFGLSGHSVYVENGSAVQQDYQASVTGDYYFSVPIGSTGTWVWRVAKYGQIFSTNTFTATGGGLFYFTPNQVTDASIVQSNVATVAAYTTLETLDKLNDYTRYYMTTNAGITLGQIISRSGATLDLLASDLLVDATAAAVFDYSGGNFTIKATVLAAAGYTQFTTTGIASVANGASISCVYTDANGTVAFVVAPSILNGSRVQLYDLTGSVELENVVLSSAGYSMKKIWSSDRTLRLRTMKLGYLPTESIGVFTASGLQFLDAQTVDTIYVGNAIDGTTVTEYTADYPSIQVDIDDPDGTTTPQRLYAWWQYNLTTASGLANYYGGIIADDEVNYRIVTASHNLYLQNTGTLATILIGARLYRDDNASIFVPGSAPIQADPSKAYVAIGSGGGGGSAIEGPWVTVLP